MSKKNAIEKSQYINNEYKEYLRSSFHFGDENVQKLYEEQLNQEELFKGPYVSLTLPFQRGRTVRQLINDGTLCSSFSRLNNISFDRPLYAHQEESINLINSGHSAVVTTGTGSGKTECFLYPILNEILRDIENGNNDVGIRAIFLYPMNALVNDQIDRLKSILSLCPDITFGFFTGDTPEKVDKNYRENEEKRGNIISTNERVSRDEIRANPPHILFTNYSMLEYLLIRPNDYSIFMPKALKNWKFVVLDEAHTYSGTLGIEISMLMRRLTGLTEKKPRFILTSATLGEEGKSENDIVEFAQKLTSTKFDVNDIIFSKRIPLNKKDFHYEVSGEDYIQLDNAQKNISIIKNIVSKYINVDTESKAELLYELLKSDKHVYRLYNNLKDKSKTFKKVLNELNDLKENELIALINLINGAEKDGIGLYDLKYHSFIRPLNGAFVTLDKDPKLSLTKRNKIENLKAFELGNCKYCNTPYIVGQIRKNLNNQLDYLLQNKEIDVYENYGENKNVSLDYFLFSDELNEDVNKDILEEYQVCIKCGEIHEAGNINAKTCKCGDNYKRSIYKVNLPRKKEESYNNISGCPCCGMHSSSGVVKLLNVGQDEGTALIGQILYEAIDEGDEEKINQPTKLSFSARRKELQPKDERTKQFLAFSDSRQQASFAAIFFDSNHTRMLRKRLIWKIIEENKYKKIDVDEAIENLRVLIKNKQLFNNNMSDYKNAWTTILTDLLKVDGSYDGEGMALYYFDLNLDDIFNHQINEQDIQDNFGQYHINKNDLEIITKVVFEQFKTAPAIDYSKSKLTPEERLENLGFRRFDNSVELLSAKGKKDIKSFLPIKAEDNYVVRYIEKVCDCNSEEAKNILREIFETIGIEGKILKQQGRDPYYKIDASNYNIKNYKESKFYQCCKCGKITPYNVHNKCVRDKCNGTLVEIDPDETLKNNYYRKKYKNKKIETVIIKEHTAQLNREKAKEYQEDFKNKKINILSCSTTFEMGIDIGDLETVFMRDVPPTPANYVQRAGRAGRRKDSSAYILTYCGSRSHDYTYFQNPEKMISGIIKPPYFDVLNQKIITRHLMAACLGFFFRKYPEYYKTIEDFVFKSGNTKFNTYIKSHPQKLNLYINQRVLPEDVYVSYRNFKWFENMGNKDEKLELFADTIKLTEEEYLQAKTEAIKCEKYRDAEYYTKQIEKLHKTKLLDALSKYCVIPKYGFPVDIVELEVYIDGKRNNDINLTRDLRIAISEYAPGSEVIVDGKKYISEYIILPKTGEFPRNFIYKCPACETVNIFPSDQEKHKCRCCGEALDDECPDFYIDPIYGFRTGINKESTRLKPKRSYAGDMTYIGGGVNEGKSLKFNDVISIVTSANDELLVKNKENFYMCPICGYTQIARRNSILKNIMKEHKNYRQFNCNNKTLQKIELGHSFRTDVARLNIPSLKLVDADNKNKSYSKALSFMYALLEGMSNALNIDRNDIDGVLDRNFETCSFDVLIFDNVPGGAGHSKRLIDKDDFIAVLQNTLDKVSQDCCDENTSCYNCLRNYYNQSFHEKLVRKYAKEETEYLLKEIRKLNNR